MPDVINVTQSNGDIVAIWAPSPNDMRKLNNNVIPNKRADLFTLRMEFQPAAPENQMVVTMWFYKNNLASYIDELLLRPDLGWINMAQINSVGAGSIDADMLFGRSVGYDDYDPTQCKGVYFKDTTPTVAQDQTEYVVCFVVRSYDADGSLVDKTTTRNMILQLPKEEPGGPLDGTGMGN